MESSTRNLALQMQQDPLHREKFCRQYGLTQREWEIALLAATRMTNAEIAKRMYLAESTVKNHMHRIFEKMQLTGTARNKRILLAELLQLK